MSITIGSARIDERGKISGGQPGDQSQLFDDNDTSGEVSMQPFYNHKKGWDILRANNIEMAKRLAEAMKRACNNKNLGYDQSKRLDVIMSSTSAKTPAGCDCSSLVRECVIEATGKDPGNFNTATEKKALIKTGLFTEVKNINFEDLRPGDVLVTKTKGHTAIVVSNSKEIDEIASTPGELDKAIDVVAKYCLRGYFGNGYGRKENIYLTVQERVNQILKGGIRV